MAQRVALVILLASAFGGGCHAHSGSDDLGEHELPDGFVDNHCQTASDCDDANACTDDACGPNQTCQNSLKTCMLDADKDPLCNEAICEPLGAGCKTQAANEGARCTDPDGLPGQCVAGSCSTLPTCDIQPIVINCSTSRSVSGSLSGASRLEHYTCASNEIGPEKAHRMRFKQDQQVTLTLSGSPDLDLLVLESAFCTEKETCAASAFNSGSGKEQVTFTAKANQTYAAVVESRVPASTSYKIDIACGGCTPTRTVDCNETIMGDSTGSSSSIGGWICDPMTPGPEDTYRLAPAANTTYRLKLTNLTKDLDLILMSEVAGQCDPEAVCRESNIKAGTADERIDFIATGGAKYDIVVDAKTSGGPYQLAVECPLTCVGSGLWLDCSTSFSHRNDDAANSSDKIDGWQCDPGTDGPEVIYIFDPPKPGSYTFELTGLSADLDLIVLEEDASTVVECDAANPCLAVGKQVGTASESVTIAAAPPKYYYIAVDGKNGAVSPYTLSVRSTACAH